MSGRLILATLLVACGSSSSPSTTPDGGPELAAPTLTARPAQGQVKLAWNAVPDATGYTIYRSPTAGTSGEMIGTTTDTQLADPAAPLFTPSYYTVAAVHGALSNEAEAFAYDLSHWTVRSTGVNLHDVAFAPASTSPTGADLYVGVGESGEVLTSPDGHTWTFQQGPRMDITAVAFGGGRFIAVGGTLGSPAAGAIATSSDGVAWTLQTAPSMNVYRDIQVAYDGPTASPTAHYITVGDNGAIATSTDGTTWTGTTCGTVAFNTVGVTHQTVATSLRFGVVAAGNATACYSFDASTWLTSATSYNLIGSATGDDDVVLMPLLGGTSGGAVVRFHFDLAAMTASLSYGTVPAIASYFVGLASTRVGLIHWIYAIDHGGHVWVSTNDGSTFTDMGASFATSLLGAPAPLNLIAAGSYLFAPGASSQLYSSADLGNTFALALDGVAPPFDSVVAGHGLSVALSPKGDTATSADGTTWTFTPGVLGASTVGTNLVVTPAGFAYLSYSVDGLSLQTSSDGVAWTATAVPDSTCGAPSCKFGTGTLIAAEDAVYAEMPGYTLGNVSRVVAVGGPASSPTAAVSTLNDVPVGLQFDGTTLSIASTLGHAIYSSADGTTWTKSDTLPFLPTGYLVDGSTRYTVGPSGQFATSVDHQDWSTPVTLTSRATYGLTKTGDGLFVIGYGGYLGRTSDGQTFTPIDLPIYADFNAMAVTDRGFVLVGNNHVILTAP